VYPVAQRWFRVIVRLLALLLTATVGLFGQSGIFGPVTTRPQAGDLAPDLTFTKELSTPPSTSWTPSRLFGQVTVLAFFPNPSYNLETVTEWNARIDQFSAKSVQFVWVTGEKESTLLPWLVEHPLKGSVLLDPAGEVGRTYGLELPVAIIVGTDGRIIGFDRELVPSADTLDAALEGRITTIPLKPGTAEFQAFIESRKVLLEVEAPRLGGGGNQNKPNYAPSYILHVLRTEVLGTREYGDDNSLGLQGFDVKGAVSRLYDINRIRIELPASFQDGEGYEFSMVLPENESRGRITERFRQGLQDYFHLTATREVRLMDVYVVTAPGQKPTALKARSKDDEGGGTKSSWIEVRGREIAGDPSREKEVPTVVSLSDVAGISLKGTMDEFCKTLERRLDRPVVNETNLKGEFAFNVKADQTATNDFLDRLRDQMGLVITPVQRNIEMLVFNPR
jgi:uncharacterized protein (TIGR03435 family)